MSPARPSPPGAGVPRTRRRWLDEPLPGGRAPWKLTARVRVRVLAATRRPTKPPTGGAGAPRPTTSAPSADSVHGLHRPRLRDEGGRHSSTSTWTRPAMRRCSASTRRPPFQAIHRRDRVLPLSPGRALRIRVQAHARPPEMGKPRTKPYAIGNSLSCRRFCFRALYCISRLCLSRLLPAVFTGSVPVNLRANRIKTEN